MAESQAVLNNLVAKGVVPRDGKAKFGRRRGKREPLAKGSLMATALDGGEASGGGGNEAQARLLMRAMIVAAVSDGALDDDERARIMDGHDDTDSDFLAAELDHPFDIPALVKSAFAQKRLLAQSPRDVTGDDLANLYKDAMRYW